MYSRKSSLFAAVVALALLASGFLFRTAYSAVDMKAQAAQQATATATVLATATPAASATPAGVQRTPTTVATLPPVQTTPSSSTTPRTISVSGSGSVEAQPDIAIVNLGVTTDAATAREALTQNNEQMEALISALTQGGIASADIRTQNLQLYPRYDTPEPQPSGQSGDTTPRLSGYTASNIVEVTVRDLDTLGQVLDQAVTAGSNQVQGIRFDVSNPAQVMDQAREAAMQDATHKAQQLATLANARLGVVITINDSSRFPLPYMAGGMDTAQEARSVPISPGTQTLTVDVQVTWELQ